MIKVEEALKFFEEHQPMPPDDETPEGLLKDFGTALEVFRTNPDARCIEPIFGAIGSIDGYGVYQDISHVMAMQPREPVVKKLRETLHSNLHYIRYISAHVAMEIVAHEVIDELIALLSDSDADVRTMAISAISVAGSDKELSLLKKHLKTEINAGVRNHLSWVIGEMAKELQKT